MQKTIYLHIGYFKTGSTSIQFLLSQNYKRLLKKGVLYPKTGRRGYKGQHHSAIPLLMCVKAGLHCPPWFKNSFSLKADPEVLIKKLVSEIDSFAGDTVVLSSEEFVRLGVAEGQAHLSRLRKYLDKYEIKIVCYIRRQDDYIESMYNEIVKCGGVPVNISENGGKPFLGGFHDYHKCLSIWSEIFGKNNIIMRIFDKESLPHGVSVDFADILQIDDIETLKEIRMNPRIDNKYVEVMRLCNQKARNKRELEAVRDFFSNLTHQEQENISRQKYRLLSLDQRKQILEYYKKCNRCMGKTFFQSKEGIFNDIAESTHLDINNRDAENEMMQYWESIKDSKYYNNAPFLKSFNSFVYVYSLYKKAVSHFFST
ncbi:hypothetical protein [Desulfopila inferna]|uniref:hypothetical protein n=1 Tax=Desulfopila inferna TaxID=468528 RepID=UPI001963ADA3|nr:hypothetical protein [Desulfopila inferna]MBM9606271.1 hypothetical protein [Desulfopila inferna]